MPGLIHIHNGQTEQSSQNIMSLLPGWDYFILHAQASNDEQIISLVQKNEIYFVIYESVLNFASARTLNHLKSEKPSVCIILFKSALQDDEFKALQYAGISHCIVGESREEILLTTLNKLWGSHWKRIPDAIFPSSCQPLPEKAQSIIHFIENHSFSECNIKNISSYTAMSESYFQKEFKKYFNLNFREFKAKLMNHYESLLLFENHLKPYHVSAILNYKNTSSFSRSFKIRNGSSWQNKSREFQS